MTDPEYQIVSLPNGECSVKDLEYGETFHPVIGPGEEAVCLYVQQLNLAERIVKQVSNPFVVWDVGLGIGANATATLDMWGTAGGHLHLISFDKTTEAGRFATLHSESLPFLTAWRNTMDELLSHCHVQVTRRSAIAEWDLVVGDFPSWLAHANHSSIPSPHAILFDPCSPAKNPEMWTAGLFRNLHRCLDPNRPCALATYSRATHIRVGLLLAGFWVGHGRSAGAKEETTMAASHPELVDRPLDRPWLERILASRSAEPLTESGYRQAPLSEKSLAKLRAHPQFV